MHSYILLSRCMRVVLLPSLESDVVSLIPDYFCASPWLWNLEIVGYTPRLLIKTIFTCTYSFEAVNFNGAVTSKEIEEDVNVYDEENMTGHHERCLGTKKMKKQKCKCQSDSWDEGLLFTGIESKWMVYILLNTYLRHLSLSWRFQETLFYEWEEQMLR